VDPVSANARSIAEFLLDNVSEGFLIRDISGTILQANPAAERMFGGLALSGSAREYIPSLRDASGTYEVETAGSHSILSVTTSTLALESGKVLYMDLLRTVKADRALRDRLVAEVQRVSKLAQTDSLTGLPNRAEFEAELDRLQGEVAEPFALAILDLDGFKEVNDLLGHSAGDSVLVEFSARLRNSVRESDIVSRLGGDEFAVILVGVARDVAAQLFDRLLEKLSFSMEIGREFVSVGASVGWAHSGDGYEFLMKEADRRMYLDKRRKKGL
jgi:diguanylate cyclase (GGDEF)-like protein